MSDWLNEYAQPDFGQIVVTSPPYNMGLVPGGNGRGMYRPGASSKGGRFRDGYEDSHDDAMPQDEYDAWQRRTLALLWELIPEDGAIFYNHRQRVEHGRARLPLGMDFPIPLRQVITWDRKTGIGPNLRHFCSVAEWVFLFATAPSCWHARCCVARRPISGRRSARGSSTPSPPASSSTPRSVRPTSPVRSGFPSVRSTWCAWGGRSRCARRCARVRWPAFSWPCNFGRR